MLQILILTALYSILNTYSTLHNTGLLSGILRSFSTLNRPEEMCSATMVRIHVFVGF